MVTLIFRRSSKKGYANPVGPTNDNPDSDHPRRKLSVAESVERKLSWVQRHDDIVGGAGGANYASKDPEEAELCQVRFE